MMSRALVVLVAAWLVVGCRPPSSKAMATESDGGSSERGATASSDTESTEGFVCSPGATRCRGEAIERCSQTGLELELDSCGPRETCVDCGPDADDDCKPTCSGPCERAGLAPSSMGCAFVLDRMPRWHTGRPDAVVVGNPNAYDWAEVRLFYVPEGKKSPEGRGMSVELAPGDRHIFTLDEPIYDYIDPARYDSSYPLDAIRLSAFRTGAHYRIESDLPLVAYMHAPRENRSNNEASMLVPDEALGQLYVAASYAPKPRTSGSIGDPSYFTVIATDNDTEVKWTPPVKTEGAGLSVGTIEAGETGTVQLGRYDVLRVAAHKELAREMTDVSGTVIESSRPVWVASGTGCAFIPTDRCCCSHIQEQMIAVESWGETYVAAATPGRKGAGTRWRVFAGADAVKITARPKQPGTPIELNKIGDWKEIVIDGAVDFVLEGDGPFLPVQYNEGKGWKDEVVTKVGDPAMHQMVPVEQFLKRYLFVTGEGYDVDYVQIIRAKGNATVRVDSAEVQDYTGVGDFEVANVKISAGSHEVVSDDPFGIVQMGFAAHASYAYPGGLRLEKIYTP